MLLTIPFLQIANSIMLKSEDEVEMQTNPMALISQNAIVKPVSIGKHALEMKSMSPRCEDFDMQERQTEYFETDADGKRIILAQNSSILSCFLLVSTMIGSGILNQPFVFKQSGIIGALLGYTLAIWATWYSLLVITHVGVEHQVYEYAALAEKAFQVAGTRTVDVAIVINSFGALLGYVLIIGETMSKFFTRWGCTAEICNLYGTTIMFITVFVLPICLLRQFGHLAIYSIFSIFTITLVLGLVTIGGPIRTRNDHIGENVILLDPLGSLQSLGSIIFALGCLPANFQVYVAARKQDRNMNSWCHITGQAVAYGAIMLLAMGMAGYLSFRGSTNGNILTNFTSNSFDFFKFMVVCHIIVYIPVDFIVMRYSVVTLFWNRKSETLSLVTHVVLTVGLLALCVAFILIMLSKGLAAGEAFSLTLNVTGGIGGSLTGFIMPGMIYLKLMPEDSKYYFESKVLIGVGALTMVLVLISTILELRK